MTPPREDSMTMVLALCAEVEVVHRRYLQWAIEITEINERVNLLMWSDPVRSLREVLVRNAARGDRMLYMGRIIRVSAGFHYLINVL